MSSTGKNNIPDAALLASIVQSSTDAIITKDLTGMITSWNRAAEELFGYSADEAVGRNVTMLIPDERLDEEPGILTRIRRGEVIEHYETVRKAIDGRLINISLTVSPIHDESGAVIGASKVARNITDRMQSETELRRYASIVESSSDAIISKDLDGIIQSWNYGAEVIFGYTAAEAVGQPVTILMPEDRIDEEPGILDRIRRGESVDHYDTVRRAKDGRMIDISLNISPVRDPNGVIIGASKIARDVTEHNRLQKAEREAEMMRRLVDTQEAERRRIARDLHDQVGQHMTALRLTLESLASSAQSSAIYDRLIKIKEIAHQLDRDISYLSWELRPAELEERGLKAALESYVKEWCGHTKIDCDYDFISDGDEHERFSPMIETNLYRIIQEALNNVAKHSHASSASFLLNRQRNLLFIIIEDNGNGFNVISPPPSTDGHGQGLIGMQERAQLLGGKLLIESSEKGTSIAVTVPVAR